MLFFTKMSPMRGGRTALRRRQRKIVKKLKKYALPFLDTIQWKTNCVLNTSDFVYTEYFAETDLDCGVNKVPI